MLMVSTTLCGGADSLVYGSKTSPNLPEFPRNWIHSLAIGTSLPELAASISLVKKGADMLLGNIVGSNLFNISLIGGLVGLLVPLVAAHQVPDWLLLSHSYHTRPGLLAKSLTKKHGVLLLLIYSLASVSTCYSILIFTGTEFSGPDG